MTAEAQTLQRRDAQRHIVGAVAALLRPVIVWVASALLALALLVGLPLAASA